MIRRPRVVVLASLCLVLPPLAAGANDTELTYGGTPRPLNGNTTVSMRSESVKMVVGDWVTVDCRFTFQNKGPARTVRMGFPDEGGDPGEEPGAKPLPPQGTFATFRSWVNGRPVQTTVIRGAEWGSVWHVKRVVFPANSTVRVRDRYTVAVGSSVAYFPASVRLARYVLHTGSSWRGPIGRSEIEVVFRRAGVRAPIVARRLPKTSDLARAALGRGLDEHCVYYEGPCKPTASGKTLRFVRTDWRPARQDDILLVFDIPRPKTSAPHRPKGAARPRPGAGGRNVTNERLFDAHRVVRLLGGSRPAAIPGGGPANQPRSRLLRAGREVSARAE